MVGLGIESGRKDIRLEVSKGKFEDVDVEKIVKQVEQSDINVMANIFMAYLVILKKLFNIHLI